MINGKHTAVVIPAYHAEKMLAVTVGEIPDPVDIRILVDDHRQSHSPAAVDCWSSSTIAIMGTDGINKLAIAMPALQPAESQAQKPSEPYDASHAATADPT